MDLAPGSWIDCEKMTVSICIHLIRCARYWIVRLRILFNTFLMRKCRSVSPARCLSVNIGKGSCILQEPSLITCSLLQRSAHRPLPETADRILQRSDRIPGRASADRRAGDHGSELLRQLRASPQEAFLAVLRETLLLEENLLLCP